MITRTFKLCLNAGTGSAPYINVSQYDEGETWLFELYSETGERYIPSTGAIVGVKSDGHGIANTGTVDNEGRVVITETQQMTASAGRAIFELSIDGLTHGTANFIVAVEKKPTDDAVMSDSDLSLIQQAVDSAEVIVEVIGDGDPSEVIGEHVDAWLDNHPEATTTVLDGAITAPKINQSLWDKLLVSEEASGNPASFDDGADDVPVSSLKVALEPIQTGTGDPSPTNVRPISGHSSVTVERCGKNLYPYETIPVYTYGWYSDYSFSGTPNKVFLKGGTSYMLSFETTASSQYVNIRAFDKSGNLITSNAIFSAHQGNEYLLPYSSSLHAFRLSAAVTYKWVRIEPTTDVYIGIVMGQDFPASTNAQLERGTEVTDYEPYTSTSYPYSLGQSVYGGTVDLATGVLTVTHGFVTLTGDASENWYLRSGTTGQYYVTNKTTDAFVVSTATQATVNGVQSNQYKSGTWAAFNNNTADIALMYGSTSVIFRNTSLADVSAVRTYLASNPLQVVYLLATPQTINLTPTQVKTLLGYNNISSTGTVDVIYHADTKLYVDKMTNVDNNIIAPTEEGFTATRNYTVNDLVIVNDTLYKVTANIATGSAITPNSNVTATTLGALIKALS